MRVDSHILRASSKAFDAMLGSNFAEGADLNHDKPKSVSLPEDSDFAMSIMPNILHFNFDQILRLES